MNRHLMLSLLIGGLLATTVLARQGVVTLKDGQKLEGDITRDEPTQVSVSVRGIETTVARDRIESVIYIDNLKDELQRRRDALAPEDAPGRIALARWAFDNRLYAEARSILDEVLDRVDPNNREAADLRNLVRRQIDLERRAANRQPEETGDTDTEPAERNPNRPPAPSDDNLLNPQQITVIKITEARERGENNLRLDVPADVRRSVTRAANVTGRRFENASALDKLRLVREHATEDDLKRVNLQGDPVVIQDFRQRIQPLVLAGCATSGCHNTPEAGNFMLFERATDERSSYTNFLILQQYVKQVDPPADAGAVGIFSGDTARVHMIDRQRPQDSLLAQYLLPANQTTHAHPAVNGYRPMARDRNDRRYVDVVRWIASLNSVPPNYQITYTPPQKSGTATQPAEAPAGQ